MSSWKTWTSSALASLALLGCSSSPESSSPPSAPDSLNVVFSPPAGTFVDTELVSLSVQADAEIHYTVDGSLPTATSPIYDAPITLSKSTRLRATAVIPGAPAGGVGGAATAGGGAGGVGTAGGGVLGGGATGSASASGRPASQGPIVTETYLRIDPNTRSFTSHLPIILIHTFDSRKLSQDATEHVPAVLEVLDSKATGSVVGRAVMDSRIGIHVRGASSRTFPKKQYAVELRGDATEDDIEQPLLGLPKSADWVLSDPVSYDRTLIRNALAFALSNRIGRYAPRTRFAEVFLVDDGGDVRAESFLGFYTLIEKIERGPERVDVTKLPATATAAPQVSGGFILRVDKGANDFSAAGKELQFVYPEPGEMKLAQRKPQVDFIRAFIDGFGQAVNAKDFTNPMTGQHYSEFIDVDAWIDHNIINALTKNVDALRISAYFHKERDERLAAGPVWDFDRSLGTPYDERAKAPEEWKLMGVDGTDYFKEGWWQLLFRDPEFKARYRDRFKALLSGEFSPDNLDRIIDGMVAEVGDAAARNFKRWTQSQPRDNSYAAEVALLKDFLRRRVVWINVQLDAGF